jgi:inner membrane protein
MSEPGSPAERANARFSASLGFAGGADWGGKAVLVLFLAVLMAIPGLLIYGLVAERTHRAQAAVIEVSNLQGGVQAVLGPQLIAPLLAPDDKGVLRSAGWWVVSPDLGHADVKVRTTTLHRGIFDVPVYRASVDLSATFMPRPPSPELLGGGQIDWSRPLIVMGFSDLRGAKSDVVATYTENGRSTALSLSPAPAVNLGQPGTQGAAQDTANGFGLVGAPGALLAATTGGVLRAHLEFTGAERISVMPYAKSTSVSMTGDWPSPSFDGGFLPTARHVDSRGFTAQWAVPFMARGLSQAGPSPVVSLTALGPKNLGVSFVRSDNPYENVTRALKYGVLFIGLVFLTYFVF